MQSHQQYRNTTVSPQVIKTKKAVPNHDTTLNKMSKHKLSLLMLAVEILQLDSMANGLVACSIEEAALGQAMASFAVTCSALPLHAATPAHKEKQKPGFA
ncbi:hypothetical protein EB796_010916 [Bugula neritina]|uniref:Uncharacterized protein n=1 Tax=Bugula neritina TaxID=10212 RepID=A0A7J7JY24_BUGNE|nr:hypothetical protein EB796_010916 [Bugula neritina]